MRRALTLLLFTMAACATTRTTPAPQPPSQTPTVTTASTEPCNPGHHILNAVLWVDTSAEYRAIATSTFAAARRSLDAALADPSWIGTPEDSVTAAAQPPAVILDLDETSIDNLEYEARAIRAGKTYDREMWTKWVSEGAARAVPGAAEFLAYANSKGVTPFYITNRDSPHEEPGTRANLERLGFPLASNVDTLLMRGKGEWKGSDKGPRRSYVAQNYRVLLVVGDDLNDFADARDKSAAQREALVNTMQDWWGVRWFMLPNPMYGSFERAVVGTEGTPCEIVQRKIDVLAKDH
jgi:5'-nucleotidase (lipoprotein e(P4) family)